MSWLATTLVLVAFAGGCFNSASVTCSDGTVCPPSTVCAPAGGSCVDPNQVTACNELPDGADCDLLAAGHGTCHTGVCVLEGCGDHRLQVGETCDDGNTISGDGCRADCHKIEVCGDAEQDANEPCDDGNMNPADGCDACVATHWVPTVAVGKIGGTDVALSGPVGAAVDEAGNLYIADTAQHRIRRVDRATGSITIAAGTGVLGSAGDGGPATSAQLSGPEAIAIDGFGNLYVADTGNSRIRRVDTETGVITTIAGTGTPGSSGDGGPAILAQLNSPSGVAVDGLGKVYIADTSNQRIRAVDPLTATINPVAGNGTTGGTGDGAAALAAQLNQPRGIAVDTSDNLYIADSNNHRIRKVTGLTITAYAGTGTSGFLGDGGQATSAQLNTPRAVQVDPAGNLFIVDGNNHLIRRVAAGTRIITTVVGATPTPGPGFTGDGGQATLAQLRSPFGIAVDPSGTLYVADTSNHRIRQITAAGVISTVAGTGEIGFTGDRSSAMTGVVVDPIGVAIDGQGNFFFAERFRNRVRRVSGATGVITTVAGTGAAGSAGDSGLATSAELNAPQGVAVDSAGTLYIADTGNNRIRRVDSAGTITTVASTVGVVAGPRGVAVDAAGLLYIADSGNHRIRRVDAAGAITTVAGTTTSGALGDNGAATSAQLNLPSGVALDAQNNFFIADTSNHKIRRVDAGTGIITTVAGTGTAGPLGDNGAATSAQLSSPTGVAVDAQGKLYIADRANHRIRRVVAGTITTVAGKGTFAFSGDGGPATNAELFTPTGVATDAAGNLTIVDAGHLVIRKVDASTGRIVTVAGQIDPEGMGPLARARLVDPRAMIITAQLTLIAGGASGTIQALRGGRLDVVAGRYPHTPATMTWARFRDSTFGPVTGIAYDVAANLIYLAESTTTTNQLHVVTMVDPADPTTWTVAAMNPVAAPGFLDGALTTAQFRLPTGLYLDPGTHVLYVADTGNQVIRAIDLSGGLATATVTTVVGRPRTIGFAGDGGLATNALLYQPRALTRCGNGDLMIADTGNNRVRRVDATKKISTVLGIGVRFSSGEGAPASSFPVDAPLGVACDDLGNLFVSSTNTVRLLPADDNKVVDGNRSVQTIYGRPPRDTFPMSVTRCLTGLQVTDPTTVRVADSCTGLVIELVRQPAP